MNKYEAEDIVKLYGYWPLFCDSKVLSFSIDMVNKRIDLTLFYIDSDQNLGAEVRLTFKSISEVKLNNVFDENVIDQLSIDEVDAIYNVGIESCYGIGGTFLCEQIESQVKSQKL